ncbi:MAG: protein BatD [Elusimicrobia bacterium]|nr:protein BatD [Elusimicrobiota bacterium]
MKRASLAILLMTFFVYIEPAIAKDIQVDLQVSSNELEVGESTELYLVFNGGTDMPAPQLNDINGFSCQYLGPATQFSIVNGNYSKTVTHQYQLIPLKAGRFKIGPFSFSFNGDKFTTSAVEVTVNGQGQGSSSSGPATTQQPGKVRNDEELKDYVFLKLSAKKNKAYVNERIPVTIKLYVRQLQINGIQSLSLNGPGFVKEEFTKPKQYRETLNGFEYAVVEFNTNLYATNDGQIVIGPAEMNCSALVVYKQKQNRRHSFFNDPFFDNFFGGAQQQSLKLISDQLVTRILSLPQEGKPREFGGAVGNFALRVTGSPLKVKAGDPITLRMEVSGEGTFDSITSPELVNAENFKLYKPEVKNNSGIKSFDQVIIPQTPEATKTPKVKFVFFNPAAQKYITLEKEGIPVSVSPADEKGAKMVDSSPTRPFTSGKSEGLGRDIEFIKDDPGEIKTSGVYLYQNGIFWLVQFFPIIFVTLAFISNRQRARWSNDQTYARKLRAPKIARAGLKKAGALLRQNKTAEFYNTIFKTLQEYLGHRFGRPSAGMVSDIVEDLIASAGLDAGLAVKLRACFSDCDLARYASARIDQNMMSGTLKNLEEIIEYLEKNKS